jgi:CheY-like chemotaxis protein/REP element-mobilizing transposase RayT
VPKQILVASPHLAFGELLRLSLEESGQYRVRLVHNGTEARGSAGRAIFSLLILDADLKDCPFVDLAREIREQQPQARLILIPPDNNSQHPALQGLTADAYLNKPFYLPDLMETVERLLAEPFQPPTPTAPTPPAQPQAVTRVQPPEPVPATERPAWLDNTSGSQRLLDEAAADERVQAALVLNGGQVCASSGILSPAALQELAAVLSRTWERHKNSDQARFVRLSEGGEHLLYATSLNGSVALALACEVTLPLTRARGKVNLLARQLSELSPTPEVIVEPAIPAPPVAVTEPEGQDTSADDGDDMEMPDIRLLELLDNAPSPDPMPQQSNHWEPEAAAETSPVSLNLPWEQILTQPPARLPDDPPSPYDAPTIAIRPRKASSDSPTVAIRRQDSDSDPAVPGEESSTGETRDLEPPPPILPPTDLSTDTPVDQSAPTPFFNPPYGSLLSVEPVSPTLSHLSYTALLLPRFPQHALVGELCEELGVWVPQLCLAFGWRLEGLAIRPDTLQFTLQVAPSVSPGNVVRILRQRTSQRIFSRFPELKELNPSGDFWAPGYLIISGSVPPQPNLLHDYVAQTRRRQGLASA